MSRPALLLSALLIGCADPPVGSGPQADGRFEWFSVPIEVRGLPPNAAFVPVSCAIDFSDLLARVQAPGAADERTIRLVGERAEPVQFSSAPQPRMGKRRLFPGTTDGVSYPGEFAGGDATEGIKVAGELAWMARADSGGSARYVLKFGVPKGGRLVQVPFPPQNLRGFDDQGRATPARDFPRMQIRPQWPLEGAVHLLDNNQEVTTYHIGPTPAVRRPYFYPVNGPDGVSLTELGKPHDPTGSHAHHYSLWIAHASVNGKDFWSERGGQILHEQFESMEDGPVFCRLVERNRWVFGDQTLLRERRTVTLYASAPDFRLMDIEIEVTPAGTEGVTLGKTTFGFLAARVAQSMTPFDGGGEIVNAKGDRNEQAAHLKRADWIDQSGPIAAGKWNGIAILDHPENANHPTGWHCRNDGWAGACFTMEGPVTVQPGAKARVRYRIVLHRGSAVAGDVARRYEEYRAKPIVEWGGPRR